MKVVVMVAGVYNGPGHRSLPWAEAGAVIEVAGGPYGDALVREGLVALHPKEGHVGPNETQVAAGPNETPGRPRKAKAKVER